jgi:hypothetical protein
VKKESKINQIKQEAQPLMIDENVLETKKMRADQNKTD